MPSAAWVRRPARPRNRKPPERAAIGGAADSLPFRGLMTGPPPTPKRTAMELLSVPFTRSRWTPAGDGLITVRGVLATEADGVVLEYASTENYWGVKPTVNTPIRTVRIPWAEVQSITYRTRLLGWGGLLVVRTRSLRALDGVPNALGNEISLAVARADRLAARDLSATVEMALADRRLAALEEGFAPPALPPG
jgi:hypothetical protein